MAMPEGDLGLARKDAGICQPLRKLGDFEFQQVMDLAVQRLTVTREAIKRVLVWLSIFVCRALPFRLRQ